MSLTDKQDPVETLSALMDGEADDLELRRLLKQIPEHQQSDELLATWRRFHLARSALHGEPVTVPATDASRRILAALELEPDHSAATQTAAARPVGTVARSRYENLAKLAVAASVALAVFLGMQVLVAPQEALPGGSSGMAHNEASGLSSEPVALKVDAEAQQRLNDYIQTVSIQHQNAAPVVNTSIFEEIPLLRQVNQVEFDLRLPTPQVDAEQEVRSR